MSEQLIKHRSKFSVLLLSLISLILIPGIGQLFGGRLKWAIIFFLSETILTTLIVASNLLDKSSSEAIMLFLLLLYSFYIAFNAYKINSNKNGIILQWYNKWYYYTAFILLALIINICLPSFQDYYHTFRIANNSNEPTLQIGERVLAKKHINNSLDPVYKISSMVVFTMPEHYGETFFIGRIVAQAGDIFLIKNGITYLNGKIIEEKYVSQPHSESVNYGPIKVPSNSFLILKDNRINIHDEYRVISQNNIQGKILYIYWSHKLHRIGLMMN